jgi:uridine kinase
MSSTVIGVAGGSGSGKTTVAQRMLDELGSARACVLHHDRYYRERLDLTFEERCTLNFDHPHALDTDLLLEHVRALKAGQAIDAPVYDFSRHARYAHTDRIEPRQTIILEGILVLAEASLRELLDVKVFVDTDPDVRFIRRMLRDTSERGRSVQSVIDQYTSTVRPMHLEFVEPSRRYADVIVPEGGDNPMAVQMLLTLVRNLT